jgi:hypothetical protein
VFPENDDDTPDEQDVRVPEVDTPNEHFVQIQEVVHIIELDSPYSDAGEAKDMHTAMNTDPGLPEIVVTPPSEQDLATRQEIFENKIYSYALGFCMLSLSNSGDPDKLAQYRAEELETLSKVIRSYLLNSKSLGSHMDATLHTNLAEWLQTPAGEERIKAVFEKVLRDCECKSLIPPPSPTIPEVVAAYQRGVADAQGCSNDAHKTRVPEAGWLATLSISAMEAYGVTVLGGIAVMLGGVFGGGWYLANAF